MGRPLSDACLAGYNATVFAYGQTGAGKASTLGIEPTTARALGIEPKPAEAP